MSDFDLVHPTTVYQEPAHTGYKDNLEKEVYNLVEEIEKKLQKTLIRVSSLPHW